MAAIGSVQRAPLFRAVRPGELSEDVLQSLQDHPVHAAIHRSCRRLLRPGLAYGPGQQVHSALKHSYDLFELMVLYRLVGMVGAALGAGWSLAEAASIERLPHEDRPKGRILDLERRGRRIGPATLPGPFPLGGPAA